MQLFSAVATMFLKRNNFFFCPQKIEKNTLKTCSEKLKSTFFHYCQHSSNGPNRRIHVQKCGLETNWGCGSKEIEG